MARSRCENHVGRIQRASQTLVFADRAARAATGREQPDVLVALADLWFESEREIEVPGKRSAGQLYKAGEQLDPTHEGALIGLFVAARAGSRRPGRARSTGRIRCRPARPSMARARRRQAS